MASDDSERGDAHPAGGAETEWVAIEKGDDLPPAGLRAIVVAGEDLLLVRQGDRYVAMDRWCLHQQGDLARGRLVGKAVKCPLHGFMYSIDTGRCLNCSGYNVRVHEVQVADGAVRVRLRK